MRQNLFAMLRAEANEAMTFEICNLFTPTWLTIRGPLCMKCALHTSLVRFAGAFRAIQGASLDEIVCSKA